jgi:hypothetical protein
VQYKEEDEMRRRKEIAWNFILPILLALKNGNKVEMKLLLFDDRRVEKRKMTD